MDKSHTFHPPPRERASRGGWEAVWAARFDRDWRSLRLARKAGENLGDDPYKAGIAFPKPALAEPRPVPQEASQQLMSLPAHTHTRTLSRPSLSLSLTHAQL
jgi:hypothetical protein